MVDLKKYRLEKGYSQIELAKKLGVARSAIAMAECGLQRPSMKLAKLLGKELGFDWYLCFEEDEKGEKQDE